MSLQSLKLLTVSHSFQKQLNPLAKNKIVSDMIFDTFPSLKNKMAVF